MDKSDDTAARAAERLTRYLSARHMRRTPERYEITRVVGRMGGMFSVEDLARRMSESGAFAVSRGTLFNTIELLVEAGVVTKHSLARAALYECNLDARPAVCLVCTGCGSARKLERAALEEYLGGVKARLFSVQQAVLYLYGTCAKCAMAEKRKKHTKGNTQTQ